MKARLAGASLWCLVSAFAFVAGARAKDDVHAFNIPDGSAEDSITLFSLQSHKSILAPGDALINIKTPAVRGVFSAATALSMLLEGTRLEVVLDDDRAIVLRKRPETTPTATEGATMLRETVPLETVTVTGFRASLTDSTYAKRVSVGFSDATFAEDIGKFPDTNIAESLNRVPGVTITREVNGEGMNVQIRGLGQNFTKILINGNPIAVASTGPTDATNSNREVDLNCSRS